VRRVACVEESTLEAAASRFVVISNIGKQFARQGLHTLCIRTYVCVLSAESDGETKRRSMYFALTFVLYSICLELFAMFARCLIFV
jgi:hypothetical protein